MPTGKPRDPQKERIWRQTLKQWQSSGLTAQAFCLKYGLSQASLYAWRRTLAARDAEAVPFAQVQIVGDERSDAAAQDNPMTLEIVLPKRRVLRIGPGFDSATLRRLLTLLEE